MYHFHLIHPLIFPIQELLVLIIPQTSLQEIYIFVDILVVRI